MNGGPFSLGWRERVLRAAKAKLAETLVRAKSKLIFEARRCRSDRKNEKPGPRFSLLLLIFSFDDDEPSRNFGSAHRRREPRINDYRGPY